ncbi:hypothetical protein LguiA_003440 [Lonicera macranthoides]
MYCKVYQTRSSNAREKVKYMIWTNEMDRWLSKILVKHVRKGYKSDNIIKPAAYAAAVAELNGRFELDLTKDHIKNRLKTWKKQYVALKEILAQNGFKWSEAQKMVVATDVAWNDYIKVHPDAKTFQAKCIENYDELCIIFGNDQAIASCSDNGDAEVMSDNEVVETGLDSEIQSGDKAAKHLMWTKEMDTCLGKILVEQVQKGKKVNNILLPEAYDAAITALNKKFGPDLTKDHIKNRLKTWKKQYGILQELLSHSGFKWDETQTMIIGTQSVWNDYIKMHPEARHFRARVVDNFDHLLIIFGKTNATGSHSRTADDIVHRLGSDSDGVEAIDATPIRCLGNTRDQEKNMMWSNEMDLFLSTMLVEQVKLGNKSKSDCKFKPAAYVAAVSALNERFQLDLTKHHIKNRINTWKKLYITVSDLLEQGKFRWDKKQKMVIANDSVWNDYIKKNHRAGFLRGRIIENYDDLCVIIGNEETTESSRNESEANLDWSADNCVETEFAYQNQRKNANDQRKYIDRCLTEKLIKQVELGDKLERKFDCVTYKAALAALNETFVPDLSQECIRSRLKKWKRLYGLVKELLSSREFEWDKKQKMIVADDSVWNKYIKMHPEAKFLRGRSIKNFEDLHISCRENEEDHVDEEMSKDESSEGTPEGSCQQQTRRATSPSLLQYKRPAKKRHRGGRDEETLVEMMSAVAANIGRIADALTASNQSVCLDEVFEMVQNIPGFDDDLIIEACEFLSVDDKRAKMFLKLDERLRKLWLIKRLRGNDSH